GSYTVEFVNPDGSVWARSTADAGGDDSLDSDAGATGMTGCYTLAAGETNLTVDAGFYKKAALGDRVWNDANNNGVQDNGETGIAGATVNLRDCSGALIATTTTDANGNYLFAGLAPGSYTVEFVNPDGSVWARSTADAGGDDSLDSDAGATGMTGCYTLAAGESNLNVDAGFYKKAALGDRVWNDANINGLQDNGETGIAGATVNLRDCSGALIATTTTDANGIYLFAGLAPGQYKIEFVNPDGSVWASAPANAGTDDTLDSDAGAAGMTGCYTLAAGETNLTVDAGFSKLAAAIDIRKQAEGPDSRTVSSGSDVTFEIVVTNTGDAPLSGVEVTDELVPSCAMVIGDLAAGASTSYTCTATNVTAGFTNIATVTGSHNGISYTDNDPSTVVIATPAIEVKKYVSVDGGSTWRDADDISDCADAPQVEACDGGGSASCGQCDGKVSDLTLAYHGTTATTVKISNKDGYVLYSGTVQPEGLIALSLADASGRLTPAIKLYVGGLFHTSIHTSCSQPIGPGLVAGNFEVVAGASLNGGELCAVSCQSNDPSPTCGICDGKVSELTLGYTGSSNAKVQIVNKDGYTLLLKNVVTPGEMLNFFLADNYGKLTTDIKIYLNGSYHTSIHTSCSQPIGPGLVAGRFQVVSGTSRNGGPLCPYDGTTVTRDDKTCDGKVSELSMVYHGKYEKLVQVKDKNGRELFRGYVKPEGKFRFAGKDSDGSCTSEVSVYVNSQLHGKVRTDCSEDVGRGSKCGDFEVSDGKSSHGGKLCGTNPGDGSYQTGQETCTYLPPAPPCTAGQVSYLFVVTNTGDSELGNIQLSDSVHTACAVSAGLAAGDSSECMIGPFDAETGLHTNTATVTGDFILNGAVVATVSDSDDASYCGTAQQPSCGLSVTKTADPATVPKPAYGDGSCYGNDGYDKDGYDKDGYDWYGYDREGCGSDGKDREGYDKDGFNRYGRCRLGHSRSDHDRYGYDRSGHDKDGYDRSGRDKNGYDRQGYDGDGYDKAGYNRHGYDRDGYDKDGYDVSGHCREGHSREAHQRAGYNRNGYDLDGYTSAGRDKDGYDRSGCDREGYDREGYDKDGWDKNGHDREGHSRDDHDGKGCQPPPASCPAGNLVTYTYTVSNAGTPVENVVVTDDKLGHVGTIATLASGESVFLTKTACIKETTTNTVTAAVESWQECSAAAETTVAAICANPPATTCNWWDWSCYVDRWGYNRSGCDREGYDWDGYSKDSRDKDGYDRSGRDKNGYDRSGSYCGTSSWSSYSSYRD
ncbi:MAG: SdrD B-like domain-containing protein, partial [Thermodesulfobacteriota bacterium]